MLKYATTIIAALFLGLLSNAYAQDDEILPPEEAFKTSVSIDKDNQIAVTIDIVDGYYLYRDKISLKSKTDGITLSELQSPAGKIKEDEFFGTVETYRGKIIVKSNATASADANALELEVKSQGCADIGICYPPMTLPFKLALTPQPTASKGNVLANLSKEFNGSFGAEEEFLDPDVAFVPVLTRIDEDGLINLNWVIADGYYLYKEKFSFELTNAGSSTIGQPQFAKGEMKDDEFFGRIEVYHQNAEVTLPLQNAASFGNGTLILHYQGCAEAGICYPPITRRLPVSWSQVNTSQSSDSSTPQAIATVTTQVDQSSQLSEQDQIASNLSSNSLWGIILSFLGLGLLLAFTPCVFPMIPILSSLIIGQGESVTTRRAFILSLVYVLAMSLTYTIAGIVVGLSGENVQAVFQNPWVLTSFSLLFVVLSLSMFGFYELQMPPSIQSKLTAMSNNQKGGTLWGVAIMGFLSALIVGPCVTAPLVGALIYIAQTGNAVVGGVALFSLSIGMGIPLLIIGVSAGKFMPRAGAWMDTTKAVFGVLLIGLAIWMLERILPLYVTMALAGILTIVSAVYMGAVDPVPTAKSRWYALWKGLGLVLLMYGVMLLVGASVGGTGFIKPLKGVFAGGSSVSSGALITNTDHIQFKQIKGVQGLQTELELAKTTGKTVMLDFYADWCISCKEMDAYTFSDKNVQAALANTVLLQTDVTKNDELDKSLLKHFGLFGPPAIIFYNNNSEEQRNSRVVGFMEADAFTAQIQRAFK